MLHQRNNFEVRRPSRSVGMIHSAIIGLVTLIFDLFYIETGARIILLGMRNLPTNFAVSGSFRSPHNSPTPVRGRTTGQAIMRPRFKVKGQRSRSPGRLMLTQ